jgi:arylsulfatase A-like enzyme
VTDAEVRVPLLVHYPQAVPAETHEQSVSTLSVLPTVAHLLEVPPHPAFQGTSLLAEEADAPRPVFLNIQGMKSQDGVVCGRYKFVRNKSAGRNELYDLIDDPGEQKELSSELPQLAEKLRVLVTAQMGQQMRYHEPGSPEVRDEFYAPRLSPCPSVAAEAVAVRHQLHSTH